MLDLSNIILENPNDAENFRYIDAGDVKGWLPLTEAEIAQKAVDRENLDAMMSNQLWSNLRSQRNKLLAESDWTQLGDTSAAKELWAAYRQILRDLPANTSDPLNPIWPAKPE